MLRHRLVPVVVVALALLVVNAIGRLVVLLAGVKADDKLLLASLYSMLAMAVVAAVAGFRWARRYEMARVVGEVGFAVVLGSLLTVLVGPLVVGASPFHGLNSFLQLLGICFGISALGAAIGVLIVLALGQDRTGRAWRYQADQYRAKPRRPAR
jgi:hypothetical protein